MNAIFKPNVKIHRAFCTSTGAAVGRLLGEGVAYMSSGGETLWISVNPGGYALAGRTIQTIYLIQMIIWMSSNEYKYVYIIHYTVANKNFAFTKKAGLQFCTKFKDLAFMKWDHNSSPCGRKMSFHHKLIGKFL